jgi:hypothetical protein
MWTHKKIDLIYIICDMWFKDKTYGFKFLIAHDFQIRLQLETTIPTFFCFFIIKKNTSN